MRGLLHTSFASHMTTKKLSAHEFDEAAKRLGRLSADTLKIARLVLVEGLTQTDVATQHEMSRQRVHNMVSRVLTALEDAPQGWVKFESWVPPALVEKIESLIEKERVKAAKLAAKK